MFAHCVLEYSHERGRPGKQQPTSKNQHGRKKRAHPTGNAEDSIRPDVRPFAPPVRQDVSCNQTQWHTKDKTAVVCKFSVYLVLRRVCLVCTKNKQLKSGFGNWGACQSSVRHLHSMVWT